MDRQSAVVMDKALLPELVHKVINPRPGGADHLGQVSLNHYGNASFVFAVLAPIGQYQENPSQTFLAGVEDLVRIILFDSNHSHHQVRDEEFGEGRILVDDA